MRQESGLEVQSMSWYESIRAIRRPSHNAMEPAAAAQSNKGFRAERHPAHENKPESDYKVSLARAFNGVPVWTIE
jgi:hypothetical protein